MDNDNISTDLVSAIWVLTLGICLLLNFNLISALFLNGWEWITNNWLVDIMELILIPYYLFVHVVLIFGFKTAMTRLK